MTQSSAAPAIAHAKSPEILSLIGDTPLVEVTQFDTGPCRLFLKLENQNPGGSIKDRIALSMIEAAEAEGKLEPGGTVIEATAGNTGLGLALVAGAKGYRVLLVIPDKMSQEKISHVRALGAEVRITRIWKNIATIPENKTLPMCRRECRCPPAEAIRPRFVRDSC